MSILETKCPRLIIRLARHIIGSRVDTTILSHTRSCDYYNLCKLAYVVFDIQLTSFCVLSCVFSIYYYNRMLCIHVCVLETPSISCTNTQC